MLCEIALVFSETRRVMLIMFVWIASEFMVMLIMFTEAIMSRTVISFSFSLTLASRALMSAWSYIMSVSVIPSLAYMPVMSLWRAVIEDSAEPSLSSSPLLAERLDSAVSSLSLSSLLRLSRNLMSYCMWEITFMSGRWLLKEPAPYTGSRAF